MKLLSNSERYDVYGAQDNNTVKPVEIYGGGNEKYGIADVTLNIPIADNIFLRPGIMVDTNGELGNAHLGVKIKI